MNRRVFIQSMAVASIVGPTQALHARCDVDTIEARLRRGERIYRERLVLSRPLRVGTKLYPKSASITECYFDLRFKGPWMQLAGDNEVV